MTSKQRDELLVDVLRTFRKNADKQQITLSDLGESLVMEYRDLNYVVVSAKIAANGGPQVKE